MAAEGGDVITLQECGHRQVQDPIPTKHAVSTNWAQVIKTEKRRKENQERTLRWGDKFEGKGGAAVGVRGGDVTWRKVQNTSNIKRNKIRIF